MQSSNDNLPQIGEFFTKFGAGIMSALVALVAKISHEILQRRKMSWMMWMAVVGVSLFWAWMAGLFCDYAQYETTYSAIIIGLATLLGERVNVYIMQNYKTWIDGFFNAIKPKK